MEAKDYIDLANLNKDLLIHRRKIEWKINFTLWGAIISLAVFLFKAGYNKSNLGIWYWVVAAILVIMAIIYILIYLPAINGSNKKDLNLILYFRGMADPSIIEKEKEANPSKVEGDTPENRLKNIHLPPRKYFWKQEGYWQNFLPNFFIMVLICVASILLLSLEGVKETQVATSYKFKGGPLNDTIGSLNGENVRLFYNEVKFPKITADGMVIKGELLKSGMFGKSSNLPFYSLNIRTNEYRWCVKKD